MSLPELPALANWAWIPIAVWAAFAQTVRNAAQRSLVAEAGALGASLARFLYGLPFAALWLLAVQALGGRPQGLPPFDAAYAAWIAFGAVAQLAATALLLAAMRQRAFVVGVAFSKTEILQVALFSTLFLHEVPTAAALLMMAVATAGVVLLSLPGKLAGVVADGALNRASAYGIASGACFALSVVAFRGAALAVPDTSPWLLGAWGVMWAQLIQSALLGGYLALRDRRALGHILRRWRPSLVAGAMGAAASVGWFTAMSAHAASDVRTVGLVEVFFSYVVSRRIFKEGLSRNEKAGMLLVFIGLIGVCLQL